MELRHYKEKVQKILEEHEQARNNDGTLIAHFVKRYYKTLLVVDPDGNEMLPLKNFKHLPPMETITRARRIIQNDNHMLIPTDPNVAKARRIKEENYRNAEVREAKIWQPPQ
jgi:CO dehydrogenase nickel-insertion accessory protein CooC1